MRAPEDRILVVIPPDDQIIGSCPMLDRRHAVPQATDPAPAIPTRNDRGDVDVDVNVDGGPAFIFGGRVVGPDPLRPEEESSGRRPPPSPPARVVANAATDIPRGGGSTTTPARKPRISGARRRSSSSIIGAGVGGGGVMVQHSMSTSSIDVRVERVRVFVSRSFGDCSHPGLLTSGRAACWESTQVGRYGIVLYYHLVNHRRQPRCRALRNLS